MAPWRPLRRFVWDGGMSVSVPAPRATTASRSCRLSKMQHGLGKHWNKSTAKLSRSVENLICEMDKMLCRHRKTGVASICGQVDQPFGQGEWASERA